MLIIEIQQQGINKQRVYNKSVQVIFFSQVIKQQDALNNLYKELKKSQIIKDMSFYTLSQSTQTITIKNKKRISLIVPYKSSELIIFYNDCCYQHRQIFDNKIIHEGKLNCQVTQLVEFQGISNQQYINKNHKIDSAGYLCLIGSKNGINYIGILNIDSKLYQSYEAIFYEANKQSETVDYHSVHNTLSKYPLLIEISLNIQNGIMIKCFDFGRAIWLNDILYCGSAFLRYFFLLVPQSLLIQNNSSSFCLISNGQKAQSVNIVWIKITESNISKCNKNEHNHNSVVSHQQSFISQSKPSSLISNLDKQKQNIMQFIFTKQVKYFKNFNIIGCHITQDGYLFFIGNTNLFDTKQRKNTQIQAISMYFNFINLTHAIDIAYKFIDLKNFNMGNGVIVRDYLGFFQNSMLFLVQSYKKVSLHKLSPTKIIQNLPNFDEQIYSFNQLRNIDIQVSMDFNSLMWYELVCEQFFEKIKDSPSMIKLKLLLKIDKNMYYKQIIQNFSPQILHNQSFIKMVLQTLS